MTQYYGPPPEQFKKTHKLRWAILILVGLGLIAIVSSCVAAAGSVSHSLNKQHTITYKVTSSGPASVDYMSADFNQAQQDISKSWSHTETVKGWQPVALDAQLKDSSGKVTCQIIVDGHGGKVITSSGAYVVASCSANTFPDDGSSSSWRWMMCVNSSGGASV